VFPPSGAVARPGSAANYFLQDLYLFSPTTAMIRAPSKLTAFRPALRHFVHTCFYLINRSPFSMLPAGAIVLTALHIITASLRL
jgi:hypothetical protein